jgi:hypothetical protein
MAPDRRKAAATATIGYTGIASAAALRHHALNAAYGGEGVKRPPLFAERKLLKTARGRGRYLSGAAIGLVAVPAAAKGTTDLFAKRASFLAQGVQGTREALTERSNNLRERPPARLVVGNYALGAGIGSGAGGLANLALRGRLKGGRKAAAAASIGAAAGALSLPAQSKIVQRASHGQYESTPTGVRRKKTAPVRPSKHATIVDGRAMSGQEFRSHTVGKADPGADMTRHHRRALVTAAGVPIPVAGDVTQALTAARLAPSGRRARAGITTVAGGQAGSLAGTAAGAGGALALAHRSKTFERHANRANEWVEGTKAKTYARMGIKPRQGPGLAVRTAERVPRLASIGRKVMANPVGRAVARRPGVAAIGALAGSSLGGMIGQQATYSHVMTADDRARAARSTDTRHGTRVVKYVQPKVLSPREQHALARRKQHSAVLSVIGGTAGLGALGATLASARHSPLKAAHKARIARLPVPLLTTGAGAGGLNAFNYAAIQRKEAASKSVSKALGLRPTGALRPPRPPGMPRVPSMRAGTIRQTRAPSGLTRTSTVRGGLA